MKRRASLGSYIRSAARATFSAYRSLPIRWRLAGGSAALTFVILAGFAGIVGALTTRQVHGEFNVEVRSAVEREVRQLSGALYYSGGEIQNCAAQMRLSDYNAEIGIYDGERLLCNPAQGKTARDRTTGSPFTPPLNAGTYQQSGYRIEARELGVQPSGEVMLVYARPLSDINHTLAKVQFFLLLGVLGGTVLALLAGLATAQRAMRPIVALTDAAREIERTRDPGVRLPHPEAHDEVAELARTLEEMLKALDQARAETETMLARQREFVADASHELRTPLTSVLANLELLTEELGGDRGDSAQAALRSAQRMRRLVGDLLLLARADARRAPPQRPTDIADVLTEAASELGPMADDHVLSIEPESAVVSGVRDDLHRMVLNLLENAVQHTPPGTHIRAGTITRDGAAVLTIEDDGPGIAPELERRIFERFVRGAGDGGRGSGLGLAIVRAVVESHGGTVALERPGGDHGTRFVIRLPSAPGPAGDQTSTTTGSTIGRRRSRS